MTATTRWRRSQRFTGPIIGAINGAAVTGGFELALACDVLLAVPPARFADTHARVGIAPGWGLSQKLSRAIGTYRAREVSLTGNWVSAEQAAAWGFVNRVVPAEELLPAARALARDMLGSVPEMLVRYKAIIDDGFALDLRRRDGPGAGTQPRVQRPGRCAGHRGAARGGARAQPRRVARRRRSPKRAYSASQAARSAFSCSRSAWRVYIMWPAS